MPVPRRRCCAVPVPYCTQMNTAAAVPTMLRFAVTLLHAIALCQRSTKPYPALPLHGITQLRSAVASHCPTSPHRHNTISCPALPLPRCADCVLPERNCRRQAPPNAALPSHFHTIAHHTATRPHGNPPCYACATPSGTPPCLRLAMPCQNEIALVPTLP